MKLMLLLLIFSIESYSASNHRDLETVDYVDAGRYVGKWYSVASLPQFFTRKCLSQTADYEIINEQTISVLNTCIKKKGVTTIEGQAVVVNSETNAELEVTFNNFFTRLFRVKGDYNIIKLHEDYSFVLIGSRDRKSLWIMSRSPNMPIEIYEEYVKEAQYQGYPTHKLVLSRFK